MNLNIMERITLVNLLPQQGNAATLRIVRDLQRELSFTEEEMEQCGMVASEERITWEPGSDFEKEIALGSRATRIIVDALEGLDKDSRLEMQHLSLLDKFGIGLD